MDASMKSFFNEYASAFSDLDINRQAEMFDDSFLTAGPKGAIARSKGEFIAMAEQIVAYYRAAGQKSARILRTVESPISPDYSLVAVRWGSTFEKTGDRLIEYDVSYIVRTTGGPPKIVMFIAHQDEEKAMRELGIMPEPAHA
jgi:hypothetical protein